MVVNYIYNEKGLAEYAVIPIQLWHLYQQQVPQLAFSNPPITTQKIFNPLKYKGLIKNLNINIEQELKNMRDEWTTDF
jgi:hypothetical protein